MKKNKNKMSEINLYGVLFIIASVLLLLSYGGFFESGIIVFGIFMLVILLSKKFVVKMGMSQTIYLVFSLWYLLCSLKNGFVTEYAARAMIPFIVFAFWLYISNISQQKEKITDIIVEISIWLAVISIIHCIVISINASALMRSVFPFDYSNACGIYFAVCYFYARHSGTRFLNKAKYVFLAALLLTQSVGAIGLFVLTLIYCFIKEKSFKQLIFTGLSVMIFAVFFYGRIIQSAGTFLERLLHIHDGILCIADNPLFGIGAGWWEFAKNYYQTGFYGAATLHSSITAIGVNSGIIGIVLFLTVCFLEIRKLIKNKGFIIPVLIILAHSVFDFTLSFPAMSVLLLLSLDYGNEEKKFTVKQIYKVIAAGAATLFCVFLMFGLYKSSVFQSDVNNNKSNWEQSFEESFFKRSSIRAAQCCCAALYSGNNDTYVSLKNYKFMPTEMILYKAKYEEGGEEYLSDMLTKQPYNTALRDYVINDFPEDTAKKAEDIVNSAVLKTSFLGEILFNLKGENK